MKGIVSFYGKSGCKGNARQIEQLKEAGYAVQVIDMLNKEWNAETLPKFFNGARPHDCINARAPQITSSEFKPEDLNSEELLQAMIQKPILIKRPLLFFRGEFACGFDHPLVKQLLDEEPIDYKCQQNESCTHPIEQSEQCSIADLHSAQ